MSYNHVHSIGTVKSSVVRSVNLDMNASPGFSFIFTEIYSNIVISH